MIPYLARGSLGTRARACAVDALRDLHPLPMTDLQGLSKCLFEEAREKRRTHPNDVMVSRRGSALRPLSFALAEDIWVLVHTITNSKAVPRTLVKNGKRGAIVLEAWRSSDKCQTLVAESSACAMSESQNASVDPPPPNEDESVLQLPRNNIVPQGPDHSSKTAEKTSDSLPSAERFGSNMIMREMNSLRTDIRTLQTQMKTLELYSNVITFQNKIDLMMKQIAELSQKPSQPLNCSPQITTLTPPDSTPESCVTPPSIPSYLIHLPFHCSLELQRSEHGASLP